MWYWIRKEHSYFSYSAYSVFNLRSPKSRNFNRKGPKVHFGSRFAADLLIVGAWPSYIKRCGQLQAIPDTSHRGPHFSSCREIAGKQPKIPEIPKTGNRKWQKNRHSTLPSSAIHLVCVLVLVFFITVKITENFRVENIWCRSKSPFQTRNGLF